MTLQHNTAPEFINKFDSARSPTENTYEDGYSPSSIPQLGYPIAFDDEPSQSQLINGQWAEVNALKEARMKVSQDHLRADMRKRTHAVPNTQISDRTISAPSFPLASQLSHMDLMAHNHFEDYLQETDDDKPEFMEACKKRIPRLVDASTSRRANHFSSGDSRDRSRSPDYSSSRMVSDDSDSESPTPRPAANALDTSPRRDRRGRITLHNRANQDISLFVTPGPDEARRRRRRRRHYRDRSPLPPSNSNNPNATTTTTTAAASAPSSDPEDDPIHRRRLRAERANPKAHPYARKQAPENDPENREIKRMRVEQRMHWEDIAAALNRARVAAGKTPGFTQAAVYGRFSRVAGRIAEVDGEEGFDYKDYLHFKHQKTGTAAGTGAGTGKERKMPALSREQEALLVECYEEVERERWRNVASKFKLKAGVRLTDEQVARKWKTL